MSFMDKDFLINLTKNIYRLTLLFPKKEPLRYKIRELADDILANLTLFPAANFQRSKNLITGAERDLGILDSFFRVANDQNWVSPSDILAVKEGYDKLGEVLKKVKLEKEDSPAGNDSLLNGIKQQPLLERQRRILEILREKGRAQVWEFKQVFPQVTKRTLRRDFEKMLSQGLIERKGEKNETFYQTKEC